MFFLVRVLTSYQLQSHDIRAIEVVLFLPRGSFCPRHPEIEHEGIEVTTGPPGQGVSNAVGLVIATKHLATKFNRPSYNVMTNHTWCIVGDACL